MWFLTSNTTTFPVTSLSEGQVDEQVKGQALHVFFSDSWNVGLH